MEPRQAEKLEKYNLPERKRCKIVDHMNQLFLTLKHSIHIRTKGCELDNGKDSQCTAHSNGCPGL
jgi:hypothetical protein